MKRNIAVLRHSRIRSHNTSSNPLRYLRNDSVTEL
jgi:hypothetical protein